jgi:tetratricopeptide (TPR) repeat protein
MTSRAWWIAALLLPILARAMPAEAQSPESLADLRRQVAPLLEREDYAAALPLLERIAEADPYSAEANVHLGVTLATLAAASDDQETRVAMRVRARTLFLKARELDTDDPTVEVLIQSIPPDGADHAKLSSNPDADRLMTSGQKLFAERKIDEALVSYQKALQLDSALYEAALYSGDIFLHKEDFAQAEVWYQKAIAIDPSRETAYRYSATPLMWQGRIAEAGERYVEAYIAEPYNRLSVAGLKHWAAQTQNSVAHPEVVVPTRVSIDASGAVHAETDHAALSKDDGSSAWAGYRGVRTTWYERRFAEVFPGEGMYRHSLQEEAEALRSVVADAVALVDGKALSPALSTLKKLDEENLLEPYILLARSNEEIARDYPDYLKLHRDRLRRYVSSYLLQPPSLR